MTPDEWPAPLAPQSPTLWPPRAADVACDSYLGAVKQLAHELSQRQHHVSLEAIPNLGHDYPPDFASAHVRCWGGRHDPGHLLSISALSRQHRRTGGDSEASLLKRRPSRRRLTRRPGETRSTDYLGEASAAPLPLARLESRRQF